MKLTPMQQYMVLGLFAFLGIGFLYYQFLLKPINKEIATLQGKLEQEKKDLESAKQIVAKYSEFKKRADSVQRELEWVESRIPKTIDRSKFLEAINFVQTRSGIVLTSFQFGSVPKANESYTEVPATLKFNTDYQGLLNFLNQVGDSSLFMMAQDLMVTQIKSLTDPNQTLTAQVVVSGIQAKQ